MGENDILCRSTKYGGGVSLYKFIRYSHTSSETTIITNKSNSPNISPNTFNQNSDNGRYPLTQGKAVF